MRRITIFLASWSAEVRAPLEVLGHTPEVCWVGAGWVPVQTDQPQRNLLEAPLWYGEPSKSGRRKSQGGISRSQTDRPETGVDVRTSPTKPETALDARPKAFDEAHRNATLPFEIRLFELPDSGVRELAGWCVLIGGRALLEERDLRESVGSVFNSENQARIARLGQLWQCVRNRLSVRGAKQYIRVSVPVTDDLESALFDLQSSLPLWLHTLNLSNSPARQEVREKH